MKSIKDINRPENRHREIGINYQFIKQDINNIHLALLKENEVLLNIQEKKSLPSPNFPILSNKAENFSEINIANSVLKEFGHDNIPTLVSREELVLRLIQKFRYLEKIQKKNIGIFFRNEIQKEITDFFVESNVITSDSEKNNYLKCAMGFYDSQSYAKYLNEKIVPSLLNNNNEIDQNNLAL